ncbi:MAG: hypothetical protein IH577_01330 [Deltaproteobacteria bacterium]|nr:hypothetical protein [Deltaproteobacteria bacterium]
MKRLFSTTVVMLLSFAMFFVLVCEGADPMTKPFNAMWSGTLYVSERCADPILTGTPSAPIFQTINVGKGVSTLSGKSDWLSVICGYFTSGTTMAGSGWGIMTAANGDTLHILIESTVDLSTVPPKWAETETVVGGTGRFEGATGISESEGTWTSGTNLFPCEPIAAPPYFQCITPPRLFQPPQGWEGTTEGEITF